MSTPIRRELDLAARERHLRLVMQILGSRDAEYRRRHEPTPPRLQESITDFGRQLRDVRRRQAELKPRVAARPSRPPRAAAR